MWQFIGYVVAPLAAYAGITYYTTPSTDEPLPQPDPTARLFAISIWLGIAVSAISIYQFWKGR
jgi:hypothetical protein